MGFTLKVFQVSAALYRSTDSSGTYRVTLYVGTIRNTM